MIKKNKKFLVISMIMSLFLTVACKDKPVGPMENKGIGPVKSLTLGAIDAEMVKKGEEIFKLKCNSCHKMDEKYVGPALKGTTTRRTPEWIMNFVLNTTEMLEKDPIAKELLVQYMTKMIEQGLTEEDARAILEYMRNYDQEAAPVK